MPGFIYKGKVIVCAGVAVTTFLDDPTVRLNLAQDGGARSKWVRHVTLHTTQGIPGGPDGRPFILRPGAGAPGNAAESNARYWHNSPTTAGAQIITDFDGTHVLTSDLVSEFAWSAGMLSTYGIGWEIVQGDTRTATPEYPHGYAYCYHDQIYKGVIPAADEISRRMGIQRQIHMPWRRGKIVARLASGGVDCVGFHGHNDSTTNRGQGDPGGVDPRTGDMDYVRKAFVAAGYEVFDYAAEADKRAWIPRQQQLNSLLGLTLDTDGVPGPATVRAIQAACAARLPGFTHEGAKHGIWVPRPGDEQAVVLCQ